MRLLHRGDHRDMRPRETRQRGDLAGVVHADLGDAEFGVRRHARQGQRQAPVVVVGGDRGMGAAERGQDGPQHLLRRRLADAAGDRDEPAGEALAGIAAKPMQAGQRVVDQQQLAGIGHVAMHHRAGRALGERIGDEARGHRRSRPARRRTDRPAGWCACRSTRRWRRTASPSRRRSPPAGRARSTARSWRGSRIGQGTDAAGPPPPNPLPQGEGE